MDAWYNDGQQNIPPQKWSQKSWMPQFFDAIKRRWNVLSNSWVLFVIELVFGWDLNSSTVWSVLARLWQVLALYLYNGRKYMCVIHPNLFQSCHFFFSCFSSSLSKLLLPVVDQYITCHHSTHLYRQSIERCYCLWCPHSGWQFWPSLFSLWHIVTQTARLNWGVTRIKRG